MQGYRVSGVAGLRQELPNGAVSKPDADQSISGYRVVEPISEICRVTSAPQRRGQDNCLVADWDWLGLIRNNYVARKREPPEAGPPRLCGRRGGIPPHDHPSPPQRVPGPPSAATGVLREHAI